jgi:hypothetical protein
VTKRYRKPHNEIITYIFGHANHSHALTGFLAGIRAGKPNAGEGFA